MKIACYVDWGWAGHHRASYQYWWWSKLIEGRDMATTLPPSSASYLGVFRPPYPFTALLVVSPEEPMQLWRTRLCLLEKQATSEPTILIFGILVCLPIPLSTCHSQVTTWCQGAANPLFRVTSHTGRRNNYQDWADPIISRVCFPNSGFQQD